MLASLLTSLLSCSLFFAPTTTPPTTPPSTPATGTPVIAPSLFVTEKPADAKAVAASKKSAKKGDTVVIEAKIGGRADPFVKNRAMFMVADRSLKSCDQIPGDTCAKPWDYCCEPPESKKTNMMTVQIVGADGKPLKVGAQGAGHLEPLALIVIEGTVAEVDDKGTFIVNATKIFVEPATKK